MNRGYITLEMVAALLLIGMALFPLAAILVHANRMQQQSALRFRVEQRLESQREWLLALPLENAYTAPGSHERNEPPYALNWLVVEQGPGLREIRLCVSGGPLSRRQSFYKSRLIEEVIYGKRLRNR